MTTSVYKLYQKVYHKNRRKSDDTLKCQIWRRQKVHNDYVRDSNWRENQSASHKERWAKNKAIREQYNCSVKEAWDILTEQEVQYTPKENKINKQLWAENKRIREENQCSIAEAWEIIRIDRANKAPPKREKSVEAWAENKRIREQYNCSIKEAWAIIREKKGH